MLYFYLQDCHHYISLPTLRPWVWHYCFVQLSLYSFLLIPYPFWPNQKWLYPQLTPPRTLTSFIFSDIFSAVLFYLVSVSANGSMFNFWISDAIRSIFSLIPCSFHAVKHRIQYKITRLMPQFPTWRIESVFVSRWVFVLATSEAVGLQIQLPFISIRTHTIKVTDKFPHGLVNE